MPTAHREPERGDLVEVHWRDICEAISDHPDKAALARRTSWGIFWGRKDDDGVPVIVTTTTVDRDGPDDAGWCCYLASCVVSMKVIKRARRPRKPRKAKHAPPAKAASPATG